MSSWRPLRALARVELRQFRRHPGRSALVLLLVAVPVAAVVGGSTLVRITQPTTEERRARALGRADLRAETSGDYEAFETLRDLLPSGTTTEKVFLGRDDVSVPGRRLRAKCWALDPATFAPPGLAAGMLHLVEGRPPTNSGEVALSPVLLEGLDRSTGETVTLSYGPRRKITGVVVDPEDLDLPVVLRTPAAVEYRGVHAFLVDIHGGDSDSIAAALREAGFFVSTRQEAGAGDELLAAIVFALGGIGFLEAGLIIAAAFAVSLRRRQREIGLLEATGATIGGIRASLLVSAVVLASVGALVGVVVGTGSAALVMPSLDGWNRRLNGGFEWSLLHVVTACILGLLAAAFAAALPVRNAARIPIRVSLSGRRPVASRSSTWLVGGLAMVGSGLLLLLFAPRDNVFTGSLGVIGGPVLGVLGFGACSPWLLDGLARRAARLPLTWRLAVRDAGRFRARNGPVVTAVLAGMSMSVTVAVLVASLESSFDALPAPLRHDQLLIDGPGAESTARRVAEELSGVAIAPLQAVYAQGQPVRARYPDVSGGIVRRREWIACGDEKLLGALNVEAAADAFRAGRLLALNPPSRAGNVQLTTWLDDRPFEPLPIEAVSLNLHVAEPLFVLDRDLLESLGWEPGPPLNRSLVPWLIRLRTPITREVLRQAQAIAAESIGTTVDAGLLHRRPARTFYRFVLLVCLLTGLVVVLVATALTAAESAADERVLHTVGAAPPVLRGHAAARAGYLALLGCALAVPAGFIPALGLFSAVKIPLSFVMPWRDVIVIVFGLPLIAYAGTWLVGFRRHGFRPPRETA